MFDMTQTLIVVYKDEMILNQFKKLIETKDDSGENIVGIKDGSVKIVAWSEQIWLEPKKAGNITSKVLYIGNVKGADKLIPVIDIKFDEYSSRFGWAGGQAAIFADVEELLNSKLYDEFLGKLKELSIPEELKEDKRAHFEIKKVKFLDKVAKGIQGIFDDKKAIYQQQLIYAVIKAYYFGLREFLEA